MIHANADNEFNWALFRGLPVVGILRGFTAVQVQKSVIAAAEGGLCNVEITMNTPGADNLIRTACELLAGKANVGAGTVCSLSDLTVALQAGASFIITPFFARDVVLECVKRQVPVFPGTMSPTEMHNAFELGVSMVKIFPAEMLGPKYLQALKGPFPNWRLMPTGGVTIASLAAYRKAGADAFGVGGPLFDKQQVAAGNWDWIREQARRFSEVYASTSDI
jgi:2-dehydro-3-deoxyphosphogluconate aldolase / (4S)-4-hydroxy-2-oxoglutarate aldolase